MMWMDAYVHDTLIRQQIAEANGRAALQHVVRTPTAPPARRVYWRDVHQLVRNALLWGRRRPAARLAVR